MKLCGIPTIHFQVLLLLVSGRVYILDALRHFDAQLSHSFHDSGYENQQTLRIGGPTATSATTWNSKQQFFNGCLVKQSFFM